MECWSCKQSFTQMDRLLNNEQDCADFSKWQLMILNTLVRDYSLQSEFIMWNEYWEDKLDTSVSWLQQTAIPMK